ncbi:UDP-glucuronosyltransferase 3A1-like [Engraulis encrasicolus]|uniref:UDP-glucuronosyltransferase 3A1-like n=1 Tax=Engraulis encrasicolus TaxID=184585 RepID=UPI002FD7544D
MAVTAFILLFLLLDFFILLHSARILTICLIGGSHYMLMDEISHSFHQSGHRVRMLLQLGNPVINGLDYAGRPDSYELSTWSPGESYIEEYNGWFLQQQKEFLLGRSNFSGFLSFMGHLAYHCDLILSDSELMSSLREESFDMALLDAFNPCSFLVASFLGLRYVAFYPGTLNGPVSVGLPSPLSYVPVFNSELSDQMGLLERVKNLLFSVVSPAAEELMHQQFRHVGERHFLSAPAMAELYGRAELWAFNTDFSLEFPQPLMPYTVLVGGMLSKPAKPVAQELEDFIGLYDESGFIVVTLGSMVSSVPLEDLLREMNAAFARVPQAVIWRYHAPRWPHHLQPAPNVKLVEWLPQNDLLGHPKARLLITHGGQNSILQAVFHSVPVLGVPLFGDQFDNLVRVRAKGLGLALRPTDIHRDLLSDTITTLITDHRYKASARSLSRMHRSQPVPPGQRLVQWVEHVLHSGGGAHLRPASLQQAWYQRCLLDVALVMALMVLGPLALVLVAFQSYSGRSKLKQA